MRWIVERSLHGRFLILAIAVAVMVFGVMQLRNAPVDALPEFGPPLVEVQTEALGLSAEEVEELITVPLEADLLNGVPWLDVIRSESVSGLSSIELVFKEGTDVLRARQMVEERLTQAAGLPQVSQPPVMLQPTSATSRVMMIGMSSEDLSLIDMSVLARWTIKPRLMGVQGVANVAIWGQREQQLHVQVDPERLRDNNVSLLQIVETTANALWASPLTFVEASTPGTGGFIDTPNQRLGIRHILPISSPSDLAQVPIDGTDGMRLDDVTDVVQDHQPLIGDALIQDGTGLLFVVEKFPEVNIVDVTRDVEDALETLAPGLSGIEFDTSIYRPATSIESAADDLGLALFVGLVVVVLVLALFSWRTALISLIAIPLSIMIAGLVLFLMGETLNAMVGAGLVAAMALLIDDVVTDIEYFLQRLRERREERSEESAASIFMEATLQTRSALFYATLIMVAAILPVFFLQREAAAFFPPLATSYLLAIGASTVVALTVTPVLSLLLLSRLPLAEREPVVIRSLQRGYRAVLSVLIRRPARVYLVVAAIILATVATAPQLDQEFLPAFKERELLIQWDGAAGASLPEMNRITSQAGSELRGIPGVQNVGGHVGRAIASDKVTNVNAGELWVTIDPSASYDATVSAVQEVISGYPGLSRDVATYPEARIREVFAEAEDDIIVRVYGANLDVLRGEAEEVRQLVSEIDGVAGERVDLPVEEATFEIEVDLAAAQRHELKPGDVRRAAAALLSGITVGSLFEEQKVFDVVVWGTPNVRHSLTSVRELLLETPNGYVQLGDIADVQVAASPNVIDREAVSRFVDVTAGATGRNRDAIVSDIESRLKDMEFPLEYHAEVLDSVGGASRTQLFTLAIVAAIGIFLLFQAAFGSWRLATIAIVSLPLALTGGVLAEFTNDGVLSLGSIAGFLVIVGIAARNLIVLFKRYQYLREEGATLGPDLVIRGAGERVAPVLMTAIAVSLMVGLMLWMSSILGAEIVEPMAIVMLGGLVTSTLLSLILAPVMYLRFAPRREIETTLSQQGIEPSAS